MACLHPITIHYDDVLTHKRRYVDVPCGKCVLCLKRVQDDWYVRMSKELEEHSSAVFFSLTYNEDNVPFSESGFRTCCKKHIQDWIKLGRELYFKKFGNRLELKYFVCSEYGPRTFRPHYHGVFFGVDKNFFNIWFGNNWRSKYGFVSVSNLWRKSNGACRYVSKYCNKGKIFECPYVKDGLVEKPFRLVSKGLGLSYVLKNKSYYYGTDINEKSDRVRRVVARMFVDCDGFSYSLPRYYRAKVFGSSQENVSKTRFRRYISNFIQSEVCHRDADFYESLVARGCSREYIDAVLRSESESSFDQAEVVYKRLVGFYDKSQL